MIHRKTLLILTLFSVIFLNLSLLLFLNIPPQNPHCDIDSKAYIEKSLTLYQTGSFAPTPAQGSFPYYTLGYPMFMALVYKIFSPQIEWVILIQILLALLSALLVFITTRRLFNETVGLIAFTVACINVGFLTFSQFILTETLLVFLLILFFERFTAYLCNKCFCVLIQAALALGISIAIKPAAIYYPILLLPLIFYTAPVSVRKKFCTFFVLCFTAPILTYMLHNKIVFNQFKITNVDSVNIYFWFYPNVLAQKYGTISDIERLKLQFMAGPDNININMVKEMFMKDLKQNPILFVYVWIKNVMKTFLGLFTTNLKVLIEPGVHGGDISFFKVKGSLLERAWLYIESGATSGWIKAVGIFEAITSILRFILCLIACFTLFYRRQYALLYLMTSYIFYFSIISGHDGCARFRMMFEFVLVILTAVGLWTLFMNKNKDNNESFCNSCGR